MSGDSSECIAALDIGTTTIRCQIFNKNADCIGASFGNIILHHPEPGAVEINPEELWTDVISVVKNAIQDANIKVEDIKSLGISTQRASFITWQKDNGKPLHNFITWKDLRASDLVRDINRSWKLWALHLGSYFAYTFTRHIKFSIVSRLRFTSSHVTVRLLWLLKTNSRVQKALLEGNLMFGTMDTWIIYKLTGEKIFVSDISNASATGMYDPFDLCWSIIPKYFNAPVHIFPEVVDNDYDFGETVADIFGIPIKIGSVMADQSASMYGSNGVDVNDFKVTLGTGAFLDINTGTMVEGGLNGTYPLIGWKLRGKLTNLLEVSCCDAGSVVEWMLKTGLISNPDESSEIAYSVKDNGGVYFVPAFSGLGPPFNNETASSGFIGIKQKTRQEHMIRAVLESIVYRITLAYKLVMKDGDREFDYLRVDGGVSKNNFICQMLADLTNMTIKRMPSEMATLGVAYVAGLSCGFWELNKMPKINTMDIFTPTERLEEKKQLNLDLECWIKAANRFLSWYN